MLNEIISQVTNVKELFLQHFSLIPITLKYSDKEGFSRYLSNLDIENLFVYLCKSRKNYDNYIVIIRERDMLFKSLSQLFLEYRELANYGYINHLDEQYYIRKGGIK